MYRPAIRAFSVAAALAGVLLLPAQAEAAKRSFVTLRDDGTISAKKLSSPVLVTDAVMTAYDKSGMKRPDVISLWTTFATNGSTIETLFDPLANDVKGIGLETAYKTSDGSGLFSSDYAPVRAILLHNDMTAIEARAAAQSTPSEGFARYLFLLELSHLWGPAVRLPASDGGPPANGLIGFDFHWSFWMDAGGSAAGGNVWKDNGDGTFTTSGQAPRTIRYSMLDLYLMGLADPSEVPAFGLLENAVPPPDVKDPFGKGSLYGASSFPWFGDKPFTVTATRRAITIQEIVAANGVRVPARASGTMTLGIVLMVKPTATDAELATLEEKFEPIAASLAPAYHEATHERGTLTNVTEQDLTITPDAGVGPEDGGVATPSPAAPAPAGESGGCAMAPATPSWVGAGSLVAAALLLRRRRRAPARGRPPIG